MLRWIWIAGLSLIVVAAACSDDETATGDTSTSAVGGGGTGGSGGAGGNGGNVCGSANAPLDESGLVELAHDQGVPATHLREQTFAIPVGNNEYVLNDEVVHEAVRFELEHPAKIYGFKVRWADMVLGIDPAAELEAGLYGDFGYNGFDFWEADPLWTGTRCAMDIDDGGTTWVTYTFAEPVIVEDPGLVYVAHRAAPGEPVWWFDEAVESSEGPPCDIFADCQSAINLPEVEKASYYNGLSFPFQYHYMVRLYVEYTDDVQPADKVFQQVQDGPAGRHVSWTDYDDDGWDDLYLSGKLWRNGGDGSFTDVTEAAGVTVSKATGGVWADYDNDGCMDLFSFVESGTVADTLFHSNCDGTFSDATAVAGIVDMQTTDACHLPGEYIRSPSPAAAWVDYDADGFVDLYIANFLCWDNPPSLPVYSDTVLHNNGDGTFSEISGQNGFSNTQYPSRSVAPIDHDRDGDVDIFVGAYLLRRNWFFENNGDGTVSEKATTVKLAGTATGFDYGHTIGSAWGDLDNDGDFDNVTANLSHPRAYDVSNKTQVLLNDGSGSYHDISGDWLTPKSDAGLRYQETHSGPVLADVDQDGILDLAIACVYDGRPTDFYWGNGDGTFTLDAYHSGITTKRGIGVAVADYDHDGDMDMFAQHLFQNGLADNAKGHWLQVRVVGTSANAAAIGATVEVTAAGVSRIRHVQGGTGQGVQDSLYLHFGLADASEVSEIRVTYPGGSEQLVAGPIAVDQRVWIIEGQAAALPGWGKPF